MLISAFPIVLLMTPYPGGESLIGSRVLVMSQRAEIDHVNHACVAGVDLDGPSEIVVGTSVPTITL